MMLLVSRRFLRPQTVSRARSVASTAVSEGKVAFIGLGNMGLPMAKNLLAAGESVTAFDVAEGPLGEITRNGGAVAASPGAAAVDADTVVTMLPGNDTVRAVYQDEGGVFDNAKDGALFIDCSTIDPGVSKQVRGGGGVGVQ